MLKEEEDEAARMLGEGKSTAVRENDGGLRPMAIEAAAQPLAERNRAVLIKCCSSPVTLAIIGFAMLALLMVLFKPGALSGRTNTGGDTNHQGGMDMGQSGGGMKPESGGTKPPSGPRSEVQIGQIRLEQDLIDYYEGNDLSAAFAIGSERGLRHVAKKIARKRRDGKPFVLGAIGDGILVGAFGNCDSDGYLAVLERTLKPIFKAKNVDFSIHRVIYGSFCGISPLTAATCLSPLIGEVDLLHYSFPHASDNSEARVRLGALANGSVHLVEPDCSGNAASQSRGKNAKFLQQFQDFGSDIVCLEEALQTIFGERYKGHLWGEEGDGIHSTVRHAKHKGIVWRNWRPGPLGHQFLADILSVYLLRALKISQSMRGEEVMDPLPSASNPPQCFASHTPSFGNSPIKLVSRGGWTKFSGEEPHEDEVPEEERGVKDCQHQAWCGYHEASSASAGDLVFDVPADTSRPERSVFVCCCCNAELCVEEQFRSYVTFKWESAVDVPENRRVSNFAGSECLEVAKNMPFANRLTISISAPKASIPVRVARLIAA